MSNTPWTWTAERVIPSQPSAGHRVIEDVLAELGRLGWTDHDLFSVRLALEEAIVNAIKHGNRLDDRKQVQVECKISRERFWIRIADEGPGFQPECVPDCTDPENLEKPSGRGIMLMRCYMSRVEYNAAGNVVEMEKERQSSAGAV